MHFYPAIDLLDGKCVRLYQGDYARETVYGDDPVSQARVFEEAGADWIHVVDLDAARTGNPINREIIAEIARAVDVPVQTGGGIRTVEAAAAHIDAGVARVVLGTAAMEDPELVASLAARYPVAVGLDARDGQIAVRGWRETSKRELLDVAATFEHDGVEALIVTEIGRDGTLEGPDVEGLSKVLEATSIPVIASGGVGSLDHLRDLARLETSHRRLQGVIVGRALYEGTFTAVEAVEACRS